MTMVAAEVDPSRHEGVLDGDRQLIAAATPDGLIRSELLQGQDVLASYRIVAAEQGRAEAFRESGRPWAFDVAG